MKTWARLLIGSGKNIEKKNMIWNMIGSFTYASASVILSFLVMGMVGDEQGGIFAFAFGTFGQQMFNVAYFGIRPYQVTDEAMEFSFGDYVQHRLTTCLAAVLIGISYLAVSGYTMEKTVVVFLMVLYKVIDGFSDVYESEFQRQGSLYLTGKSTTFRTALAVASFLVTLAVTGNLVSACVMSVAGQMFGFLLFDWAVLRELPSVDWKRAAGQWRKLTRGTGLLFLSVFLDFYILSSAKYAIDAKLEDSASGYFNIIFMPTQVINLVAGFVIRPFLTSLTDFWNHKKFAEFKNQVFRIAGIIGGLTVLAVVGTLVLGKPVLRLLEMILGAGYEGSLTCYHRAFLCIILGGGCYAMSNLMYYVLVIMRRQKYIFATYLTAAVVAVFMTSYMVAGWGIDGAAYAYLMLMAVQTLGFGLQAAVGFRKNQKSEEI